VEFVSFCLCVLNLKENKILILARKRLNGQARSGHYEFGLYPRKDERGDIPVVAFWDAVSYQENSDLGVQLGGPLVVLGANTSTVASRVVKGAWWRG
jgi:hypothetical protein